MTCCFKSVNLMILFCHYLDLSYALEENDFGKLLFTNVLFRHGDRTPIDPYPNDPYKNRSLWPVGFGQMTNTGKRQEYELGRYLRMRYASLLPETYSEDDVFVQSTDVDRTLMSAMACLAGLYPPHGSQVWDPNLPWQPIPVHTTPKHLDKMLAAHAPCPAYDKEYKKVLDSKEIEDLNNKFSNIYKILNQNTGANIPTLEEVEYVYNTLYIESLFNFTLPPWTEPIFPSPMDEASHYSFALPTWSQKLARLKTGLLVADMIEHMNAKRAGQLAPDRSAWLYSAHDSTVANLLNTLGVFEPHNPPYSAAVLVELRLVSNDTYYVTVFYRNSSLHEPTLLTVPSCSPLCPLDQFISLCQPIIPQNWDKECQTASIFTIAPSNALTLTALGIAAILILLFVASISLHYKRSQPTHWYQRLKTDNL